VEEERARHNPRACAFLGKPFISKALVETIQNCLAGSSEPRPASTAH
jgi:hypothetical protein